MTVKQLIAKLKKMPQSLEVYIADHDHGTYEINSSAHNVYHIEKPDPEYDDHYDVKEWEHQTKDYSKHPEQYVVIRP